MDGKTKKKKRIKKMNTSEIAQKLHDHFWSQYGYEVRVTNEVRPDGKKEKNL